jgi:hypothetical protein
MKKVNIEIKKWTPLWEAIKFPLRLLVLAIIPFTIAYLAKSGYEWAAGATAFLAFLDKFLHEQWKIEKDEDKLKGIVPF